MHMQVTPINAEKITSVAKMRLSDIRIHKSPLVFQPKSAQITPRVKDIGVARNMSDCFNAIFDKEYGCARPDNPNKASCFADRIKYALECFFLGKSAENTSYYIDMNNEHLSCQNKTGYTFEQAKNLFSCANTFGFVTNNVCNLESRPSQGTEPSGTYPFCDCEGTSHDASDQPRSFKPHKAWNAVTQQCECDPLSSYKFPSKDTRCCSAEICSTENHEEYDCDDEECKCESNYVKIIEPGNPEDGTCMLPCSPPTQNNPINYSSGQAGCKTPTTLEIVNGYMVGKLDDLCCQNNACVQETNTSSPLASAKLSCINDTPKCTWLVPPSGMYSCPRSGSEHYMLCDKNEMPIGTNLWEYVCGIDIPSFNGLLGCSNNQCQADCETRCFEKGKSYVSSTCTGTQPNPSKYPDLYSGNCQCQCADP